MIERLKHARLLSAAATKQIKEMQRCVDEAYAPMLGLLDGMDSMESGNVNGEINGAGGTNKVAQ